MWQNILNNKIDNLGDNPTDDEVSEVVDWSVSNIPLASWGVAAEIGLDLGCGDYYTYMSERLGESGFY